MAQHAGARKSTACLDFRQSKISRRGALRVGAIGFAGLSLPVLLQAPRLHKVPALRVLDARNRAF